MTGCIVFIPGLWGGDEEDILFTIPSALKKKGITFLVADSPDDTEIAELAKVLDATVRQAAQLGGPIHLIGHSMGGIVGRYYLRFIWDSVTLPIKTFTTLSTPHLGTPFASDFGAKLDRAIDDLSYFGVQKFNHPGSPVYCPPHPKVQNYSYGSAMPDFWNALKQGTLWELWLRYKLSGILKDEGRPPENDSVVPLFSQRWGTYLGTMPVAHRYFSLITGYKNPDVVSFYVSYFNFLEASLEKR